MSHLMAGALKTEAQSDYERAARRDVRISHTETGEHHALGPGVPILQLVCGECGEVLIENLFTGGLPRSFNPHVITERMMVHIHRLRAAGVGAIRHS